MITLELKKNKRYKICSCGISKMLPLCDNQHRILNNKNKVNFKSVKIISNKDVVLNLESKKWSDNNE